MTRLPVALATVLILSACSSGGPPPPEPAPEITVPGAPVEIVVRDPMPEPLPDIRCDEVVALAAAGDHKPAVDRMKEITRTEAFCPEEVLVAADGSRRLLAEADALIHSSTEKKRIGDVSGARADLRGAIDVYPKYYWARKLLRDLGGSESSAPGPETDTVAQHAAAAAPEKPQARSDVEADVEVIRQLIAEQNLELARIAEQQGDLAAASRWAITAIKAEPEDGELKRGIVEYARLLGLKFFSAGELSPAREIWGAAYALDESDERLRDYLRQVDERLANLEQIRSKGGR